MAKLRLDQLLLERGLVESRSQAQRLIMAGLVYVNGQKADKAGSSFDIAAEVIIRETLRYVSRGGLKLEKALNVFAFDPQGCTCLDVGASTGGFTDVLLQNGAQRVYAVDVGHGQLHYRLRQDPRVINLERTHVRNLTAALVPEPVHALVIDTSFISLSKVLPHAWTFLQPGGWCVALIKPQFEVGPKHLRKGVVRDEQIRRQAIEGVLSLAGTLKACRVIGVEQSPITGPKGNIEYLLGLLRER